MLSFMVEKVINIESRSKHNGFTQYILNEDFKQLRQSFDKHTINKRDKLGRTPLFYAAFFNRFESLKLLLNLGANPFVVDNNLENIYDVTHDKKIKTFLEKEMKYYFKKHFNNMDLFNKQTALQLFSYFNYVEGVVKLIENKININNKFDKFLRTPLIRSLEREELSDVFFILIENNANVNAKDIYCRTPLFYSIFNKSILSISEIMVEAGANVNVFDKYGNTLLHAAVLNGDMNKVLYTLQTLNIDINTPNNDGETPIYYAVRRGNLRILSYLLKKGSSFNDDLLHVAVWHGNLEVIKFLIDELKIDINARNKYGETPLHYAAKTNNEQLITYLLNRGANPNIKDNEHRTPYDVTYLISSRLLLKSYM